MCCFGVLTLRRSIRYTRPIAMPGDAGMPNRIVEPPTSATLSSILPELVAHQLRQRFQRGCGIFPDGRDLDEGPFGGDEHQDAHDALAIDGLTVLLDLHL